MANAINKPTYTVDAQGHIHHIDSGDRIPEGTASFIGETELEALAATWPDSRLLEIWNRLPGKTKIKKFTDRKAAVRRIWKAIENLSRPASRRVKTQQVKSQSPAAPPAGTKSEIVLALLRQPGGASLQALMAATGWQAHSVRGFISGQISKKMRLKIKSFKRERDGQRVYSIRP
jgi:hypothetical protein